jgi:16S rRNA processing protein RimM
VVPPAFLLVGKLHRPHGVRGEMIMSVLTDFPERLKPKLEVFLGPSHTPVMIKSLRHHNRGMLIALEGYDSREAVNGLRNHEIFVPTEDRPPLPDGEYYLHQLVGLTAITEDGDSLGIVSDWIETGANGVFVVRDKEGNEILLPDIDEVVLKIDLEAGEMLVHLMEGL